LLERKLSDRRVGKESKEQAKSHVPNLGIEAKGVNDDVDSLHHSMPRCFGFLDLICPLCSADYSEVTQSTRITSSSAM
jgi:hypothetical protein